MGRIQIVRVGNARTSIIKISYLHLMKKRIKVSIIQLGVQRKLYAKEVFVG